MKYLNSIFFFKKRKNSILIFLGAVILYHGKSPIEFYYKSRNWPSTEAEILSIKTNVINKNKNESYSPYVKFLYKVDNKIYESTNISYKNPIFIKKEEITDFLKKYPLGSYQHVFYEPKNPNNAYLDISVNFKNFYQILIGLFTAFTGLASFIMRKIIKRVLLSFALLNGGIIIILNSKDNFFNFITGSEDISILNSGKLASGVFITGLGYKYIKPIISEVKSYVLSYKNKLLSK